MDEQFLNHLDEWIGGKIDSKTFIKRTTLYDHIVDKVYQKMDEIDEENATFQDIVECGVYIYCYINKANDFLEINHSNHLDDSLIYLIAERLKNKFINNEVVAPRSTEDLASVISKQVSDKNNNRRIECSGNLYIMKNGVIISHEESSVQALNELIYEKRIGNTDLASACGLSKKLVTDIRSGDISIGKEILFVFAYALRLSSKEFVKLYDALPPNERADISGEFEKLLIHELDQLPVKRRIPELSNLNAIQYIAWLADYYHVEEKWVL